MYAKSLELSQTLCDLMDCSLSGSSVQGIPQAGILDGLPRPPPGDRPDQGIKPTSLLAASVCTMGKGTDIYFYLCLCKVMLTHGLGKNANSEKGYPV